MFLYFVVLSSSQVYDKQFEDNLVQQALLGYRDVI